MALLPPELEAVLGPSSNQTMLFVVVMVVSGPLVRAVPAFTVYVMLIQPVAASTE